MGRGFGGGMGRGGGGRGMGGGLGGGPGVGGGFGRGRADGAPAGRWGQRLVPGGWRQWWQGSAVPEWLRGALAGPFSAPATELAPEQEMQLLAERVEQLRSELDRVEQRLEELRQRPVAESNPPEQVDP